jgi:hypothetical protein|tara:strand:- start:436 stop:774 length:339 start_codon:yes stop_codon:yes gene_type:complete
MDNTAAALPQSITIGYQTITLIQLDTMISTNVGEQLGSYIAGPPAIIYLDKTIIEQGGPVALNVVMHELNHHVEYAASLEEADEEIRVTAYANMWTEIWTRSELRDWLKANI